jgi:hypothetical protein
MSGFKFSLLINLNVINNKFLEKSNHQLHVRQNSRRLLNLGNKMVDQRANICIFDLWLKSVDQHVINKSPFYFGPINTISVKTSMPSILVFFVFLEFPKLSCVVVKPLMALYLCIPICQFHQFWPSYFINIRPKHQNAGQTPCQ